MIKLPVVIPSDPTASLNNLRSFFKDLQVNGYNFGTQQADVADLQRQITALTKTVTTLQSGGASGSDDSAILQIMMG